MKKIVAIPLLLLAMTNVLADECSVDVSADDRMQFSLKKITVLKSCEEFTVNLSHIGQIPKAAMGHNVVISKTSDIVDIASDGMSEGLENNYLKPRDRRVIAFSPIIGGGEKTAVTFKTKLLDNSADYSFFCGFPGHFMIMKGKIIIAE